MSKNALVITGADFSVNKLTTVILDGGSDKPCTALELSESSKSVTSLGDIALTATKTPADTTDALLWTSSDESVATVENGTVSVVGLGTATITVTCGEQTATCEVTCSEVTLSPDYAFMKRQNISSYPDYFGYSDSLRELMICNENSSGALKMLKNQTLDTSLKYAPILIPNGTAAITLSYGSDMRAGTIYFGWLDTNTEAYSAHPECAKCVELNTSNSSAYNQAKTWTYEVAEGANSFAIVVTPVSSNYSESDTPEAIALAKGIVVKAIASVEE